MAYLADVMTLVSAPPDFVAWSPERKLERYERVIQWHDYIRGLNGSQKVKWAWGSHALLSNFRMSPSQGTLIYIVSAESLEEYTTILEGDPLRDISTYMTLPLSPIDADFEQDKQRRELRTELDIQGTLGSAFVDAERSTVRRPPSFHDRANPKVAKPANPPCDLDDKEDYGVSYLLYGTGLSQAAEWSDLKRSIYEEKIQWWHSFAADMVEQGKMTHAWATHAFCDTGRLESNRRGGAAILKAEDFDEVDEIYRLNPLSSEAEFVSIALRPLARQREADAARVELARTRIQ